MHPNPAFRDDAAALDRVAAIGFAHIAIVTPAGPMMVHAPVTRHAAGLRFHVARHNRTTPHLDGAMAGVSAPVFLVSD
jgi:transcriptional regulator